MTIQDYLYVSLCCLWVTLPQKRPVMNELDDYQFKDDSQFCVNGKEMSMCADDYDAHHVSQNMPDGQLGSCVDDNRVISILPQPGSGNDQFGFIFTEDRSKSNVGKDGIPANTTGGLSSNCQQGDQINSDNVINIVPQAESTDGRCGDKEDELLFINCKTENKDILADVEEEQYVTSRKLYNKQPENVEDDGNIVTQESANRENMATPNSLDDSEPTPFELSPNSWGNSEQTGSFHLISTDGSHPSVSEWPEKI